MVLSPLEVFSLLKKDEIFLQWKKNHLQCYLSHFFLPLLPDFVPRGNWEVGLFNPDDEKITIFALLEKGDFAIKPADEVFKEKATRIEELKMDSVKVGFEQVQQAFAENGAELFPQEVLGNGFLTLQCLSGVTRWNVNFMTQTFKFAQLQVDAESGDIIGHGLINFIDRVQKGKSSG